MQDGGMLTDPYNEVAVACRTLLTRPCHTGLDMNGLVTELPDDQWVKEVVNWENYAWAGFQIMLSDAAIGPILRTQLADSYTDAPATAADSTLCQSMKMRKAGGFA